MVGKQIIKLWPIEYARKIQDGRESNAGLPKCQCPVIRFININNPNEIRSGIAPKNMADQGYRLYPNKP